ncbi:hypothetical protein N7507_006799 [Penicillium longicatenatum]|nr:hypothetical protein N7507_006799 [Penicillium longicatenatum]
MKETHAAHCTTVLDRLNECLPQIHQIREICKVPSITFGVVHEGKVVFKEAIGHRDVEGNLQPDADTIYMISSCSKMFTVAAVGILVEEGLLSWKDPIQKYLSDFDPKHWTYCSKYVGFGAQGSILTNKEDLIPFLNMMPTSDKKGQKFNREWDYNNFMVGLIPLVVQKVSYQRFADFSEKKTGNCLSRDKDHGKPHLQYILGKSAESFQMIGHTGGMDGSIFTVFTFPETQSAAVTMTNGRDFGDASDFTAQILTQALFDLKPSIDLIPWAKREAELRPSHHEIRLGRPWTENRCSSAPRRDIALYVGQYRGFGDRFTLTINTECATCHEVFNVDAKISVVFQ